MSTPLALFEQYHGGPASDAAATTITRLVAESSRFDLARWEWIVKRLAKNRRTKGRADLAALEYRRVARRATPVATPKIDPAAYALLQAESQRAETERRRSMDELVNYTSEFPKSSP